MRSSQSSPMANTQDFREENMVFKLELEPQPLSNKTVMENYQDSKMECSSEAEEKDSSETLPFPDDNIPLAVPMMAANTTHSSVTRNDAKKITQSRLKRLRDLAQRPDDTLSKNQKNEKKRIIRLEKNRRAAAMSRRKKKMYVKNLEENSKLMARHIAILEMENAHLRAFMNLQPQGPSMRPGLPAMNPMYKMQQFASCNNMAQFVAPSAAPNVYSGPITQNCSSTNSLEPPTKRRKLNGKSDSDDVSEVEEKKCSIDTIPRPVNPGNAALLTPVMQRMLPMVPPQGIHPHNMNGYPMAPPPPSMMIQNGMLPNSAAPRVTQQTHEGVSTLPEIGKLEGIISDRVQKSSYIDRRDSVDEYERKSLETDDDAPPDVQVTHNDFCDLSLLGDNEDEVISGTVDECGSVLDFASHIKSNRVYL